MDKEKKTAYHVNVDNLQDDQQEDVNEARAWQQKQATPHKTVYKHDRNFTPHVNTEEFYDDDEVVERRKKPRRKRRRMSEPVYLTQVRLMGLMNQRYQLMEGETTIGREDYELPSDIMVKGDSTMSRQSVAIIIEDDGYGYEYRMKVLNATNRVCVNGQRVKEGDESFLEFGDVIVLGKTKFKFDNH